MTLAIPEGYKRCLKASDCKHPNGPILPATREYFYKSGTRGCGLHSWCIECFRAYNKKRIADDEIRERWYARNREYNKVHNHLPEVVARKRAHQTTDEYRAAKRVYFNTYSKTDEFRVKRNAYMTSPKGVQRRQKRRALTVGLPSDFTAEDWTTSLDYWNYSCVYCGKPRDLWGNLQQDHFIPLVSGGGYTRDNVVPACRYCNPSKQHFDPHEWVIKKFGKRKGKEILARIEAYFEWTRQREDKAS